MKNILTLLLFLVLSVSAFAQQGGYQVGQSVQDLNALGNFSSSKAVAVIFVNSTCPNSRLYESRLQNLAGTYSSQGVSFVFVNAPINMQDGSSIAKEMVQKVTGGASLPTISDENQKITTQFGATKTPEAFLFQNTSGNFTLKYKGAIDDNPQLEASVKENYLRNAIDALLANRAAPTSEKRAIGRLIKRY